MRSKRILYVIYILVCFFALVSFTYYGLVYFNGYNSDLAIPVLMAEDFQLPRDFYFRGQDRLGSLIPLLASILTFFGVNALWATAIIPYVLLLACFVLLQGFFKAYWQKLILGLILFFPHWAFIEQVLPGHPYVAHLFFLVLFIKIFNTSLLNLFKYPLLALIAFAMVWASEMAAINIIAFAVVWFKDWKPILNSRKTLIATVISVLFGAILLLWAKKEAQNAANFYQFLASPAEIMHALGNIVNQLVNVINIEGNKPPVVVLFWLMLICVLLIIIIKPKVNKIASFFLLSAAGMFIMVVISHWSALNNYPFRYYTLAYIQLLFALILISKSKIFILELATISICFATALSGIYLVRNFSLEVDERMNLSQMQEIASKGNVGVIGSYWNSYGIDALSQKVVATPHEDSFLRMPEKVEDVFSKDSILLIKNEAFSELSDTVYQYNHMLILTSELYSLDEFEYAFYKH